jgi:hypothetical protein
MFKKPSKKKLIRYTIHKTNKESLNHLITCGKIPPGPEVLLTAAVAILLASSADHSMAGLANSMLVDCG